MTAGNILVDSFGSCKICRQAIFGRAVLSPGLPFIAPTERSRQTRMQFLITGLRVVVISFFDVRRVGCTGIYSSHGCFINAMLQPVRGAAFITRQDSDFSKPDRDVFDTLDHGVSHVGDQDGQRWHGQQRPENKKRFAAVASGLKVSVTKGQEGGVRKVQRFKVRPVLIPFCAVEDQSTNRPLLQVSGFPIKTGPSSP